MRNNVRMSAVERAEPAFRICFVCTGNICRSPMAEAISRDMAARDGYGDHLAFDSAGTGDWHVGEKADPRTLDWFERFDLIVTFDPSQERILKTWADTPEQRAIIRSLLSFSDLSDEYGDVPDPYYGSDDLFNEVRDLIEHACEQLLAQVEPVARAARETAIP
jgi:protein-tyrosine phosphatase